jgi:poly-gamma-glutamate synthesis protein (capsule biosynthesis protein)
VPFDNTEVHGVELIIPGVSVKALSFFLTLVIFFLFFLPGKLFADEITVVALGDMYPGGRAVPFIEKYGCDYLFGPTKDILKDGDIVIANLESPLTERKDIFMEKEYILKADPKTAEGMKNASIDVVTLANNHIMDFGISGLKDTKEALDGHGILYTGAGDDLREARRPVLFEVKGVKIAVLAYSNTYPKEFNAKIGSPGTAPGFAKHVRKDVRGARTRADIIIVSFHWGEERLKSPKDYQVRLAHIAIESGAQLVIGHHPHVIQGIEVYKGGLIFYSLGNFVFGFYSPPDTEGMIAKVVFEEREDGYRPKSARVIPLDVDNKRVKFQATPLEGEMAAEKLKDIEQRSEPFYSVFHEKDGPGTGDIVIGALSAPQPLQ